MNFDLNQASEKLVNNNKTYQKPGIFENVVIETVTATTNSNGNDYIQMTTIGSNGELGRSPQMYLTEKAWPMTARNIKDLLVATNNITDEEAGDMVKVETKEQLATKLSALVIGKKFRAKFKGDQSATGTIFANLGGSESMKISTEDTKLFFNEAKDIKKYEGTLQSKEATMNPQTTQDSLPF